MTRNAAPSCSAPDPTPAPCSPSPSAPTGFSTSSCSRGWFARGGGPRGPRRSRSFARSRSRTGPTLADRSCAGTTSWSRPSTCCASPAGCAARTSMRADVADAVLETVAPAPEVRRATWRPAWLLLPILLLSGAALAGAMRRTSTTFDEILLPTAGARGYAIGKFDLVLDHPPLLQYVY